MKISGGSLKGRAIEFRPHPALRPTPDKVRSAIMNMLAAILPEARVLDLFAGTGALGFEAISRGARESVFVEKDPGQAKLIRKCAAALGAEDRCGYLTVDAFDGLRSLTEKGERFDLIFADPPYRQGMGEQLAAQIAGQLILNAGGYFVLEMHRKETVPEPGSLLSIYTIKQYGDTKVALYGAA